MTLARYWARRELNRLLSAVSHILVEHRTGAWQTKPWCVLSASPLWSDESVVACKWDDQHLYDEPGHISRALPSCQACNEFAHYWKKTVGFVGKDRRK